MLPDLVSLQNDLRVIVAIGSELLTWADLDHFLGLHLHKLVDSFFDSSIQVDDSILDLLLLWLVLKLVLHLLCCCCRIRSVGSLLPTTLLNSRKVWRRGIMRSQNCGRSYRPMRRP